MNSSKERLKQFKNSLDFLDDSADMEDYHRLIDTLKNLYEDGELDWIHRYAKEQAGRVQDLEHQNEVLNNTLSDMPGIQKGYMKNIEKQNKRYRATIQELNYIIGEAIESIDNGEKVQGLEHAIKISYEALEGES